MNIFYVYCILVSQSRKGRKTKATGINIDNYNLFIICGIPGENRHTGAKFPMEIIDLIH